MPSKELVNFDMHGGFLSILSMSACKQFVDYVKGAGGGREGGGNCWLCEGGEAEREGECSQL